jgi:hypothetical protein
MPLEVIVQRAVWPLTDLLEALDRVRVVVDVTNGHGISLLVRITGAPPPSRMIGGASPSKHGDLTVRVAPLSRYPGRGSTRSRCRARAEGDRLADERYDERAAPAERPELRGDLIVGIGEDVRNADRAMLAGV